MSEIKATRSVDGVTVEVYPGGAMSSLSLTRQALARGPHTLATTIVKAVAEATAVANQRTRSALSAALTESDLAVLGLTQDPVLTERAESTTPDTWRTP